MNVLVTAGGTVAPIDDVRQITNVSTGLFGARIAEAALRRGANVFYLHASGALLPFDRLMKFNLDAADPEVEIQRLLDIKVEWSHLKRRCFLFPLKMGTVEDYQETLRPGFDYVRMDVAFLAMAVSDFAPEPVAGKLSSNANTLTIQCRRQPKVIQSVRDWSPETYLVGFKLLSNAPESELIRQAEDACMTNRADLTVANDLKTVRAGQHTIHLVRIGQPVETYGPEGDIAEQLVDRVFTWTAERNPPNL